MIDSYLKYIKEQTRHDIDPYGEDKWDNVWHINTTTFSVIPENIDRDILMDHIKYTIMSYSVNSDTPNGEFYREHLKSILDSYPDNEMVKKQNIIIKNIYEGISKSIVEIDDDTIKIESDFDIEIDLFNQHDVIDWIYEYGFCQISQVFLTNETEKFPDVSYRTYLLIFQNFIKNAKVIVR